MKNKLFKLLLILILPLTMLFSTACGGGDGDLNVIVDFHDENGNLLETKIVNALSEAVYSGLVPTKQADASYSYRFVYWVDQNGYKYTPCMIFKDVILKPYFEAIPKA